MADAPLVVRVAANLQEFRENFAQNVVGTIDTTKGALSTMSTAFDGSKIIAQANATQIAIEKLGGTTSLTKDEQARANQILEAAIDKYRALGRDVPPQLQQLANDTKKVEQETSGLEKTVNRAVDAFVAYATAKFSYDHVKQILDEASALKDLANETHMSVEELQILSGAMSEFGVDSETLAKGIFRLSQGIAGGDESAASGLHKMGLSLKDVEGLNGRELFLKIEDGLAKLQGGLRDSTAAELFGTKLGGAMARASEDVRGAISTWERMNHVMSTDTVNALDSYGEAIARANKNLNALQANLAGPVADGFNTLFDAAGKGASKWSIFAAVVKDELVNAMSRGQAVGTNLATLLDQLNQKAEQNTTAALNQADAHNAVTSAMSDEAKAAKVMAAIEADAAKPLLEWQREYLDHLREIGLLNEKNIPSYVATVGQLNVYRSAVEKTKQELQAFLEQQKDNEETLAAIEKMTFQLRMDHDRQEREERQKKLQFMNDQIIAELNAQEQLNAMYGLDVDGKVKVTGAAETLRQKLEELNRLKEQGVDVSRREALAEAEFTAALQEEAKAMTIVGHGADDIEAGFGHAARGAAVFHGEMVLVAADLDDLNKKLSDFYDSLSRGGGIGIPSGTNAGSIGTPTGGSGLMPRIAGARATGGPVDAGRDYFVGERGPEILRMGSSGGYITPNVATDSSPQIIQLVVDGRVLAEVVNRQNMRDVRSTRKLGSA